MTRLQPAISDMGLIRTAATPNVKSNGNSTSLLSLDSSGIESREFKLMLCVLTYELAEIN